MALLRRVKLSVTRVWTVDGMASPVVKRSARRRTCPGVELSTTRFTWTGSVSNPGLRDDRAWHGRNLLWKVIFCPMIPVCQKKKSLFSAVCQVSLICPSSKSNMQTCVAFMEWHSQAKTEVLGQKLCPTATLSITSLIGWTKWHWHSFSLGFCLLHPTVSGHLPHILIATYSKYDFRATCYRNRICTCNLIPI